MPTKRRPLPRGAFGEIDQAIMSLAAATRVILNIARQPGSDGRLTEVVFNIHESIEAMNRAKAVRPPEPEDVADAIIAVLVERNVIDPGSDYTEMREQIRRRIADT